LEKYWKNIGKILEKYWKNIGKILEKYLLITLFTGTNFGFGSI
jgi:hypothetical protein